MTFDSVILAAIAAELSRQVTNGKVNSIYQPAPLDIILNMHAAGGRFALLISANSDFPRIHLTSTKPENPRTPPPFCMMLRKHLSGARLTRISQVDMDRILHLQFTAYDGNRTMLVVEIMGKHSNIILLSDGGRILGAIKPIGPTRSRYRQILPGRDYVPPPTPGKVDPLSVSRDEFDRLLNDTFDKEAQDVPSWLVQRFAGISPFAAREIAARAQGPTSRLRDEFLAFMDDVGEARFHPVLLTDHAGRTTGFYPFRLKNWPPQNQHERSSINSAADAYYLSALPRHTTERALADFRSRVRKEYETRDRAVASMREALARCAEAERLRQLGDLILAQQRSVVAGASEATLIDYYDPAAPEIVVRLDSQLSAAENANAYFRKYQKAAAQESVLRDRLVEEEAQLRLLKRVVDGLDAVDSIEKIHELTEVLQSGGIRLHTRQTQAGPQDKPDFEGHRIKVFKADGWEILAGQNSEANDYLITRVADANDWWVHVKASPSAHVIIRTGGHPDSVPRSVLYAAAEIAVQNSDAKHSSLVPVDYTLRKHVRRPKGASPGKVIYQREKTIFVTPTIGS